MVFPVEPSGFSNGAASLNFQVNIGNRNLLPMKSSKSKLIA
jgi:hypothetical protein